MASLVQDITQLLSAINAGDDQAGDDLLPLVYDELRRMAALKMKGERPGHTLQATALVHEAWMRLSAEEGGQFECRAHFFSAAAQAMRRILVDSARRRAAARRGGNSEHVDVESVEILAPSGTDDELLAVNDALDRLSEVDARKAEVVKMRYFAGLTFEELAPLLEISVPTAHRDWAYARAWLHLEISNSRGNV